MTQNQHPSGRESEIYARWILDGQGDPSESLKILATEHLALLEKYEQLHTEFRIREEDYLNLQKHHTIAIRKLLDSEAKT